MFGGVVIVGGMAGRFIPMKTIVRTLSAVIAGALLNLGLSRPAEWFDPISLNDATVMRTEMEMAAACAACIVPDKSELLS